MTLILGSWLISAAGETPLKDHGVRTLGGRIERVAANSALRSEYPDDEVVSGESHVIMPGFVNAHTHLYGVLAHGLPATHAPQEFWSFLNDYWWPGVEDVLDHDMIAAATDWACAEMLRSGITTFFDIVEAPYALPEVLLAQKEIVDRRGLRGLLSFEATERAGHDIAQRGLDENVALINETRSGDSLVSGVMSWHTVFTCSPAFISRAHGLAGDLGVLTHAHCNESTHEGAWADEHLGMRTLEHYRAIGISGPGFLASQCVDLSPAEMDIVVEDEVRVCHMPLANCEVGGGIAPVPELIGAGVTMGLGTDGYINDFFEVMRGAFLLHKARLQNPGTMPAPVVLDMATHAGARALGLDRVGRLEAGSAADLQVVNAEFPTPVEAHNLAEQIVLWRNHTHVRDVMVAGTWRVRNGEVLNTDLDALRMATQAQARRLWKAA